MVRAVGLWILTLGAPAAAVVKKHSTGAAPIRAEEIKVVEHHVNRQKQGKSRVQEPEDRLLVACDGGNGDPNTKGYYEGDRPPNEDHDGAEPLIDVVTKLRRPCMHWRGRRVQQRRERYGMMLSQGRQKDAQVKPFRKA